MAKLYRVGKNYYVRILHQGQDVRRKVGADRKAAEAVLAKIELELTMSKAAGFAWTGLEQIKQTRKPKTFAEVAADYLDERAHYKASSISSYRSICKTYLLPEFGKKYLTSITEAKIAKFQSKLSQRVSASRTNTIIQLLRSMMATAVRRGYITSDPCADIKRLQEPRVKVDPLSEDELSRAIAKLHPHYIPLFITLAYTGARPNELLALRWKDVDWSRKVFNISKGRVRGKEGLPKTSSSERELPILGPVEEALLSLQRRSVASLDGYIFTNQKGQPIDKHLDRIWARALKKAGLRHRPSYQLRHTFASLCLAKGMAPGYIAKLLGHSTLETFYRHYARWINDSSKQQENQLRDIFGSTVSFVQSQFGL